MQLADLHCDALCRAAAHGGRPEDAKETLPHEGLDGRLQALAIFLHDSCNGEEEAARQLSVYDRWVADGVIATQPEAGKTCGFLTYENAGKLPAAMRTAAFMARRKIRFASLTWNGENELAGGVGVGGSIKPAGYSFLREMEKAGVCPDVSHLSDEGFDQLFDAFSGPVSATHSNCRAICPHRRNLTDDQIRRIFQRGGLIGINLHQPFLSAAQTNSVEESCAVIRQHIQHMLDLGGADFLCMGCDFDGGSPIFGIDSALALAILYADVLKYFHSEQFARKLFYQNAANFLQRNKKESS